MEIGNIQNQGPLKAEELKEAKSAKNRAVNAYAKAERNDSVDVSSKAKLLLKLRESYDKLPDAKSAGQTAELKEKLEKGTVHLSSEEIVSSILQGSLFEVI
jgi:anti-sigma28 factor (negative regulator of flagellin synthesis)